MLDIDGIVVKALKKMALALYCVAMAATCVGSIFLMPKVLLTIATHYEGVVGFIALCLLMHICALSHRALSNGLSDF